VQWPLRAGLHAPEFWVDDLEAARAAMPGACLGEVVPVPGGVRDGATRGCTVVAPGDVRAELWEIAA
jgi:hypothetical protein